MAVVSVICVITVGVVVGYWKSAGCSYH